MNEMSKSLVDFKMLRALEKVRNGPKPLTNALHLGLLLLTSLVILYGYLNVNFVSSQINKIKILNAHNFIKLFSLIKQ